MNGSKKMQYRASVCFMLMYCSLTPLFAEQQSAEEEIPTMEFLEFLGEWETEEGEWIDPVVLENEEFGKLIETVIEIDNEN